MEQKQLEQLPWTKKYEPTKVSEILGQDKSMSTLMSFIQNFSPKLKKKGIILYGPTGCGKTSAIYAIAEDLGMEIYEVNSSDFRDSKSIQDTVGNAIKQVSLFGKKKIILIDDVDGMSGTGDRGGASAIEKIIDDSKFPVILTATDPWDSKLKGLRKKTMMIGFDELGYLSVAKIIKNVCDNEGIEHSEKSINSLARMSGGDARAAINDLQILCTKEKKINDKNILEIYQRYKKETILEALVKVFKPNTIELSKGAFNNIDENMDRILLWVDNNLPKEYKKPQELKKAYDMMSLSVLYNARIRKRQYWRLLSYIYSFVSEGIAIAKKEPIREYTKYEQSDRILKLWIAKNKNATRKVIAQRIAEKTHTSEKDALQEILPYIKIICRSDKKIGEKVCNYFEFDEKEKKWLSK